MQKGRWVQVAPLVAAATATTLLQLKHWQHCMPVGVVRRAREKTGGRCANSGPRPGGQLGHGTTGWQHSKLWWKSRRAMFSDTMPPVALTLCWEPGLQYTSSLQVEKRCATHPCTAAIVLTTAGPADEQSKLTWDPCILQQCSWCGRVKADIGLQQQHVHSSFLVSGQSATHDIADIQPSSTWCAADALVAHPAGKCVTKHCAVRGTCFHCNAHLQLNTAAIQQRTVFRPQCSCTCC